MSLEQQRIDLCNELNITIKSLAKYGNDLAKAEYEYKIAVNQKALQLKEDGLASTLINLVIYGYKDIAQLRLKRDIAESMRNVALESINSIKLQLRLIENQISREYSNQNNL